ncbi:hypothetical protein MARBORIA2_06400 [Methanobrevibacter arboriphilus]|uniref:hypothetical protein n=1 Tax=Methanobrevibacter arboriphilus TaxID=39441 RepID=UPI0022EFD460|nr:hypothetical protein [Methanobrevibacter arboriphilus]GLI11550.1 hypothetical protein MARBORIA2_06400 [Methanobrevibacter arboriphilus]
MLKKMKFYIFRILQNNRITGTIDLILWIVIIVTALIWFKFNIQELEPITIILTSLIGIFAIIKIFVVEPVIPEITFSEYKSENKMESSFFMGVTFTDMQEAIDISKTEEKGLFLVIYDNKHSTKSKLNYSLGFFTDYEITKRLINENFI